MKQRHIWAKILASKILQKTDIVKAVHYNGKPPYIEVDYKTEYTERFLCDGRPRRTRRNHFVLNSEVEFNRDIPIRQQYALDPLDEIEQQAKYHHIIDREDWEIASIPEQRIAYHRFLYKLLESAETGDFYPRQQRASDQTFIKHDKPERYMHQGNFYLYPAGLNINTPWRRLAEHFFKVSPPLPLDNLNVALRTIAKKVKYDITTYEVRKKAALSLGSRAFNPVVYRAIMERLGVEDTVIDLHPELGHKAMACAILGIKYICPKNKVFEAALEAGFADEFGLVHEWLDGQKAHTIISDGNFSEFDIEPALKIADNANMLIAFTKAVDRIENTKKYKPQRSYVLRLSRIRKPGFILVW